MEKLKNKAKIIKLIKFLSIYFGVIALYYVFISLESNSIFEYYIQMTSIISGAFIRLFDSSVVVNGDLISGKTFTIILSFGCEGSEPLAVFIAGILAYPSLLKAKLKGLMIGVPSLYILNILRIAALYAIGNVYPQAFDFFHITVFPVIFILVALLFWVLWIKRIADIKQ